MKKQKLRQFKILRQKNGDIPITILVMGVFAVCGLALISFYISGIDGKETSTRAGMVEKIKSLEKEIKFYSGPEINKNPMEVMELFNEGIVEDNLIFTGIRENNNYKITGTYFEYDFQAFGFKVGERKAIFSIEYSFVS